MNIVINISNKEFRFTSFRGVDFETKLDESVFSSRLFEKYQVALRLIKDKVTETLKGEGLESIIISYPGEVNPESGLLIDSYSFESWNGSNLCKDLELHFNCKVLIENDAILFGLAQRFNSSPTKKKILNILFGSDSGIGGSIIHSVDNQLIIHAVEIGHFVVVPDGERCECGQRGCLESYSSVKALTELYGDIPQDGFEEESAILASRYLAQAILSVIAITNIDSIIFGGDLALHNKVFLDSLASITSQLMAKRNRWLKIPEILVSSLNSSAIEIGALHYLKEKEKITNLNYQNL